MRLAPVSLVTVWGHVTGSQDVWESVQHSSSALHTARTVSELTGECLHRVSEHECRERAVCIKCIKSKYQSSE